MRAGWVSVLSLVVLGCATLGACTTTSPEGAELASSELDALEGELTLADVQRALRAKQASWTAGETSVSKLPYAERKRMLGVPSSEAPEEPMFVKDDPAEATIAEARAATFDWRDADGNNYVSPMADQGRCGSCVAFATVGTLETQLNIAARDPSSPWQLSPQHLFACGGGSCGFGWYPSSAARFVVNRGVPDNACMPYTSGAHGDDARCSTACTDAAARSMKARSYTTPTTGATSVAAVKRALAKGPLVASMTVYDDFMFYTGGVYKHVTGNRAGGHAVSIVGWNDDHRSWIVRNSWGTGWGVEGYFEIAWDDVSGVGAQTWGFEVPSPGSYVALAGLRDGAVLSGQHVLEFDTQSIGAAAVSWTLHKGTSVVAQGTATDGTSATLDTTSVPDGVYVLQPHATSGTTRVDGPRRLVYVLNGPLSGNIRFTRLTPNQVVRGTLMFDVAVASQPVPATRVAWTVKDAAGTVIVNRTAGNVGSLMELGWNTTRVPNGSYTIEVTGGVGEQALEPASVTVVVRN